MKRLAFSRLLSTRFRTGHSCTATNLSALWTICGNTSLVRHPNVRLFSGSILCLLVWFYFPRRVFRGFQPYSFERLTLWGRKVSSEGIRRFLLPIALLTGSSSSRLLSVTVATQPVSMGSCRHVFFKVLDSIGPLEIPHRAPDGSSEHSCEGKGTVCFLLSQPLHPRSNSSHQAPIQSTIPSSLVYYLILRAIPSACTAEVSDLPYLHPRIVSGSRFLYSLVESRPQHFVGFLVSVRVHPPQAFPSVSGA